MGNQDQSKKGPNWSAVGEDAIAGAVSLVAGATGGPIVGLAAGVLVKATGELLRAHVAERVVSRTEAFAASVTETLNGDVAKLEKKLEDENAREVLFQNYRRAMDAIDPIVVPALARLAAMYVDQKADAFFRAAGRLLQDLGASELDALRVMLSAAVRVDAPTIAIVPWTTKSGRELRYQPGGELTMTKERTPILGTTRPSDAIAVLRLIERVGLAEERERSGMDLTVHGDTMLTHDSVERLLACVGAVEVDAAPAAFDNQPEELDPFAGEGERMAEELARGMEERLLTDLQVDARSTSGRRP
jgi:hypothetical protein